MISQMANICLALDNIRSTYNVGSIFRTSDAVGISKIYLCGITPSPIDRFGRERKDIAKVALGAEKNIAWESVDNLKDLIIKLKKEGYTIVALEQSEKSVNFRDIKCKDKTLVILGEETKGISVEILDVCDQIVEIPMNGSKESLNVSVATGILLYELIK